VIAAGYPDNMEAFLKSNPGLKSRFDRTFNFPDFTTIELHKIAIGMLDEENLKPDAQADQYIKWYLEQLHKKRDKFFGNARTIRRLIEEAIKNQNLRMALMSADNRTPDMLDTLTYLDIKEVKVEDAQRQAIGFKY